MKEKPQAKEASSKVSKEKKEVVFIPGQAEKNVDDIFRTAKKDKKIQKESKEDKKDRIKEELEEKLKKQWKKEEKMMREGKTEEVTGRKSKDGLNMYTEDELKIGKGGNTALCPIDCQCCF